jgi:hypothetical protein
MTIGLWFGWLNGFGWMWFYVRRVGKRIGTVKEQVVAVVVVIVVIVVVLIVIIFIIIMI